MIFGKYKDKSLEEIYQIYKEYLLWCIDNVKHDINNIKSFIEHKKINNNNENLIKIKVYKVNGIRCIKEKNNYYEYMSDKKEN